MGLAQGLGAPHLRHKLAVDRDTGAAVVVEAVAVAALLVGIQVDAAGLGRPVPDQVQPLVQLPQLRQQSPGSGPRNASDASTKPEQQHVVAATWWWLPLPLVMISTPESARAMCGAAGVKSSSHVSAASTASFSCSAASPRGHARCPVMRRTSCGSPCSSTSRGRFQLLKYLDSLLAHPCVARHQSRQHRMVVPKR